MYTDLSLTEQIEALTKERLTEQQRGRQFASATIGQIVLVNAQRRLTGEPLLDERTLTRLTHYSEQTRNGYSSSRVPRVDVYDGRLRLEDTNVRIGWNYHGVRRALRVPVAGAAIVESA